MDTVLCNHFVGAKGKISILPILSGGGVIWKILKGNFLKSNGSTVSLTQSYFLPHFEHFFYLQIKILKVHFNLFGTSCILLRTKNSRNTLSLKIHVSVLIFQFVSGSGLLLQSIIDSVQYISVKPFFQHEHSQDGKANPLLNRFSTA